MRSPANIPSARQTYALLSSKSEKYDERTEIYDLLERVFGIHPDLNNSS